jgi:PKD repeat protein
VKSKSATVENALVPNSSLRQVAFGGTVDAFQLHSMPGASRVIYLDFTGHTTSGTVWNSTFTGGKNIVTPPFDMDGNPSSFSASERAVIEGVWKRVAEDYAPFAINVTTQDPGTQALQAGGTRVVIGPDTWYSPGVGGVGYVGSFGWNSDTPCFVFSDSLLNHDKYIGEAASHEVGHTVGLEHDGAGGTEYYGGHGNWAPIMGVGYYKAITQFSRGEYSGASNTEDDLAVISRYAPIASDDHGNATSSATLLSGSSIADGGTIETRADVDVFRFDTGSGYISLNVTSPAPEANLHIRAELLNSSGQVLQANDASTLSASFAPYLSAGTYYLRISGIGSGDYTDYGSLGNYIITGSLLQTAGKQAPSAAASANPTSGTAPLAVGFSAQGSSDPDGAIASYSWNFGNGATSSSMNPATTYNNAGTYTAVLTVTDNDGLQSSASVTIYVSAAVTANQPPVALASGTSSTSGIAPLTIQFNGGNSYDPEGGSLSYVWDFGDGTGSWNVAPAHTYSAGNYTARLTVTDNQGATASTTVSVSVQSGVQTSTQKFGVSQYTLSASNAPNGTSATGYIALRDDQGIPVAGATITVRWSGVVSGNSTFVTDSSGVATVGSKGTKRTGTITGTITNVSAPNGAVLVSNLWGVGMSQSVTTP